MGKTLLRQRFCSDHRARLDAEAGVRGRTELLCKVVDACVQLFGGYGYMNEFPITRMYADARVRRIYGGTTEIMKELIARSLWRSVDVARLPFPERRAQLALDHLAGGRRRCSSPSSAGH